jgi:hypothetical protein
MHPVESESTHFLGLPWHNYGEEPLHFPRPRQDYMVRRAFLQSYQLSAQENFRDWLRRNLREARKAGKAVISRIVSDRFAMRKLRNAFISGISPFRCFHSREGGYIGDFF